MTKAADKKRAVELRKENCSLKEIAEQLKVSKGTVSVWVRHIPSSRAEEARQDTTNLDKAREKVKSNRVQRWEGYYQEAKSLWPSLCLKKDFVLGLGLYIGEGSKMSPSDTSISNCDPRVHLAFLRFLKIVGVQADRVVLRVQAHNPKPEIVKWWATTLALDVGQIQMTQATASRSSKLTKKPQPYGTASLRVRRETELRQKLEIWMQLALQG